MKRRRGFALIQMVLTLVLTSIALWMGTMLITRLWQINANASAAHATAMGFEQMMTLLRRDAGAATALKVSDPRELVAGDVRWLVEGKEMTRVEGRSARSWHLDAPAKFVAIPGGAVLEIDYGRETPTRLPVINAVQWASEVAK